MTGTRKRRQGKVDLKDELSFGAKPKVNLNKYTHKHKYKRKHSLQTTNKHNFNQDDSNSNDVSVVSEFEFDGDIREMMRANDKLVETLLNTLLPSTKQQLYGRQTTSKLEQQQQFA